jgi:glycosyltransferase involved in cell wall biosynthesis
MAFTASVRYSFPMKIVIATPFYPPEKGVLGMYAKGLEEAFGKKGITVTTLVFSAISLPPGLRHVVYFLKLLSSLRGADYILALDTWSVGLPAFFAAKVTRTPLLYRIGGDFLWEAYVERTQKHVLLSEVYSMRTTFSLKERMIFNAIRMQLRAAHTLFFNAQFLLDLWQPVFTFDRTKAQVLENAYPARERTIEPARGKIFVSAGRPIALKNYSMLERVFAKLKEKYPDIALDTRLLPPKEHAERLRHAYAVIIPSFSEVSSNMAIASVTAGKPFIMTSDTGTKERLGECGLFIDTRNEREIIAAIEKLLDHSEYQRLIDACTAFSFTRSWDEIANDILGAV